MGSQRRILVVDDEQELTRTLGDFLLSRDYRVYQAVSGEEALQHLNSVPLDLVLLDLRLPKMQGTEILESIRRRDPHLPVIVVTAYAASHTEQLQTLKPHRILEKPLSLTALMEAIASLEGTPSVAKEETLVQGVVRILVVDPVEATAAMLRQELEKRQWPGRAFVVEQALSRDAARRISDRPDLVLINLEVLKDGRTVAMEQINYMQMGGRSWRPSDIICYGAATSEAAKQQLKTAGVRSVEITVDGKERIQRLVEAVENFAVRQAK